MLKLYLFLSLRSLPADLALENVDQRKRAIYAMIPSSGAAGELIQNQP